MFIASTSANGTAIPMLSAIAGCATIALLLTLATVRPRQGRRVEARAE